MTPPTDCAALARAQRRGGAVLYAAAKGFVSTLTRGQAKEVIGKRSPLDAVAPGAIATPYHYRYSDAATNEACARPLRSDASERRRNASAYLFLASEALTGYIVGRIIEVTAASSRHDDFGAPIGDIAGCVSCAGPAGRTGRSTPAS